MYVSNMKTKQTGYYLKISTFKYLIAQSLRDQNCPNCQLLEISLETSLNFSFGFLPRPPPHTPLDCCPIFGEDNENVS